MATAGEVLRRNVQESYELSEKELHVLAVDDSIIDRKVIEKLLKISCCKGMLYASEWVVMGPNGGFWLVTETKFGFCFAVTAVESGTRALQYLGLDGEKSSVGFDVRKLASSK